MYSPESINTLKERIKWNNSLDSGFSVELSEDNKKGTSNKHFQSFHSLVCIDNIYASVPDVNMDSDEFNELLSDIRLQATLQTINDVLESNLDYVVETDYSDVMISKASLFDNAIGYKCAINVLEMFLSSTRSNLDERNAKLSASNLKLELKGFKNDNGHVVATGLETFYQSAVKKASSKLFPLEVIVKNGKSW